MYVSTLLALSGRLPSGSELQEGNFACLAARRNSTAEWVRLTPEPAALSLGFTLSLPIGGLDIGLDNLPIINPGRAAAHLLKVDINTVEHDDRQRSPVSVQAVSVKFDLAPEYEIAQMLFRSLAECLGFLRRVDPTESDLEEFITSHERLYSVANRNSDDSR